MANHITAIIDGPYKGSGNLTREQFYFFEMRTTAKLKVSGMADEQITKAIVAENLFQYPTERTIKKAASVCLARLRLLDDTQLVCAVAQMDSVTAKQICLYAMMKQYRLIWDFMITVVGAKYRQRDYSFSRRDITGFLMGLQEQNETVASWSESTVKKIGSVISRILIENEYISNGKISHLNPVLISATLENAIRASGQELALPAFNCLN